MQRTNTTTRTRLAIAALGITLVAAACSSENIQSDAATVATVEVAESTRVATDEAPEPVEAEASTAEPVALTPEPAAPTSEPDPADQPEPPTKDEEDVDPPVDPPPPPAADDLVAPPVDPTPPPPPTIGDIAVTPVDPPEPPVIDKLAPPADPVQCGTLPAVPGDALIGSDLWYDADGGGADDDRLVAYFDGDWKIRAEFSFGTQSEIMIPGAGVHGARVLGFADVDHTYGGEEIIAVVGGGASAVEIGVFSFYEGGCIFRYQADGGGDFSVLSGASIGNGSGVICGEGFITAWGYEQDEEATYSVSSASFEPVSLGVFGYQPGSDGYVEGLSLDDISTNLFDCNGLSI